MWAFSSNRCPLKQDVDSALEAFREAEMAVELPRERVTAFIKRADALAESKRSVYVTLRVSKGQLSLSFVTKVVGAIRPRTAPRILFSNPTSSASSPRSTSGLIFASTTT